MRHTKTHPHRRDTYAVICSVRGRWEKTAGMERRATLSDKKGTGTFTSVRGPKGVFCTKDEILRMKLTLQIGDIIHGIILFFVHNPVPISKATKIPPVKIARGSRLEDIFLQERLEN